MRRNLPLATRNSSAFTLIELLVVCLLIAVMAALIVPEMRSSFEDAVLRSSGRNLVDVLGLTYSRAVSQNQLHRLRLDKTSGRYVIEKQVGDGQEDSAFETASDVAGFTGQIDPRISIDFQKQENSPEDPDSQTDSPGRKTPSDAISFYPDGTADECDILLRDRMGYQLVLQVNPHTGRVHLLESSQAK